jgi:hypothetical protein
MLGRDFTLYIYICRDKFEFRILHLFISIISIDEFLIIKLFEEKKEYKS